MLVLTESGGIPVVDPSAADGVFSLTWLVIGLPLLGAVLLLVGGALRPGRSRAGATGSAPLMPVGSFALSVVLFVELLGREESDRQVVQHLYDWIQVGGLDVGADLLYDPLTALFLLLITGVGSLIHVYSIGYMEHDERRRRFFGYLNLFVAAMLVLVLAENYLVLFLGWEGVGLASYLLIGFWQHKPSAAAGGQEGLRHQPRRRHGPLAGDHVLLRHLRHDVVLAISHAAGGASETTMTLLGLMLLLGACGKSAQVPLQAWLLDAMEGPTPVSALIHAATMVTAGVYLVVRSNFVFERAPGAQTVGRGRRHRHPALGRGDRLRQGRHQEGARRLHDEPDRLHDARPPASASRATRSRSSTCSPTASSRPTCSSAPAR